MSDVYESIVAGLQEAIEDAKSKEKNKISVFFHKFSPV